VVFRIITDQLVQR